jgi:hypothetical protein
VSVDAAGKRAHSRSRGTMERKPRTAERFIANVPLVNTLSFRFRTGPVHVSLKLLSASGSAGAEANMRRCVVAAMTMILLAAMLLSARGEEGEMGLTVAGMRSSELQTRLRQFGARKRDQGLHRQSRPGRPARPLPARALHTRHPANCRGAKLELLRDELRKLRAAVVLQALLDDFAG